ncbi:hypothetical protein CTA2_1464 [Colletotrichum tanaceti]|nr:hypothetical protein CTA2_1464 [Colletotrichum tanaceti]
MAKEQVQILLFPSIWEEEQVVVVVVAVRTAALNQILRSSSQVANIESPNKHPHLCLPDYSVLPVRISY